MTNSDQGLVVIFLFLHMGLKSNLMNKPQLWRDKWKNASLYLQKNLAFCGNLLPQRWQRPYPATEGGVVQVRERAVEGWAWPRDS